MKRENRTDRILVLVALAIFIMASGLFYFDGWIWGNRHSRSDHIGVLASRSGDVRMKFNGELKWQKASNGQDLIYNDAVYAGAGARAQLQLGESEMTVSENTLIVLRRDQNVNFMNLAYGNLFGNIAKNEKVIIDTGEGKPIELTTSSRTSIVLKKTGRHTELEVVSGDAKVKIDGKDTHLTKSTRVMVDEKNTSKMEPVALQLVHPLSSQVVYSGAPTTIPFAWKWNTGRTPTRDERYTVEFSESPAFAELKAKRDVRGALTTNLPVVESTSLFYRVRAPGGVLSGIEKINFVRMGKPIIIKPVVQDRILTSRDSKAPVEIVFERPPNSSVFYQIARDAEFQGVVVAENTPQEKRVQELPAGRYFVRAKGGFGGTHWTDWTEPVPFTVETRQDILPLVQMRDKTRVIIPNRDYPPALYQSAAPKVENYLAGRGLLRNFFAVPAGGMDELRVQFENAEARAQHDNSWPVNRIHPAQYKFKYQYSKEGWQLSPWSTPKKLEISMEPPRPVGNVRYGNTDVKSGMTEAEWDFTPLLFARSYDVEISHDPYMRAPTELKVERPMVKTQLRGDNYWRVRARDAQGHIISEFSQTQKLLAMVPQFLAKNDLTPKPPPERKPAAVEKTVTRIEHKGDVPYDKNGWWMWVGGGENYVNYQQSMQAIGTLSDQHLRGPSEYLEAGYSGHSGTGGVMTFKSTLGELDPANAAIDSTVYKWKTFSLEGTSTHLSKFTFVGMPITYGFRAGLQQHQLPFVVFNTSDGSLSMRSNTMNNASLGTTAEMVRRRWTYYWMIRYQYPLSSSASGSSQFAIKPVFDFDGSIGTSYNLTRQLKLGLFWYGQWHQFNFDYGDGEQSYTGFQSLFYSNVDLRLGFDF